MGGGASDSIYETLMVHNVLYNTSQISCKISVFTYPLSKGSVMLCYKERHPLLLDYFIAFLRCIRMVGRSTGGLYDLLMGYTTCHFYQ